jgi:hypothetical protein
MTFEAVSGPDACQGRTCIVASGPIDERTADDFDRFLKDHAETKGGLLILDSEGGALLQSLQLGNEIRHAGLDTTVAAFDQDSRSLKGGVCASACAYAFLGGVQRSLAPGARIGVHQIASRGETWALSTQSGLELMSLVATHVRHLCGGLDLLIPAMSTPPQQVYWLSRSELTRYRVVTAASAQG